MTMPRHIHEHPQDGDGNPGHCSCRMPWGGWTVADLRPDLAEAAAIGRRFDGFLTTGEREALARLGAAAGSAR